MLRALAQTAVRARGLPAIIHLQQALLTTVAFRQPHLCVQLHVPFPPPPSTLALSNHRQLLFDPPCSTIFARALHATVPSGAQPATAADIDAENKSEPPAEAEPTLKEDVYGHGYVAPHPGIQSDYSGDRTYMLMHPVYSREYVESVVPRHKPPVKINEKVGQSLINLMRRSFDLATGYGKNMDEVKWLQRFIFLETIAGVPGMVAGMLRHLKSLRTMQRDHGWIHTLMEEAENERMHLLTFLRLRQPGIIFRAMVLVSQGVFFNMYMLGYLLSPKTAHAFVGYLEEEAVKTYTSAIKELDAGKLPAWSTMPAPIIAINYWRLPKDAKIRDVILAIRADEACHSHVNHTFSELKPYNDNPFTRDSHMVP